MTGPERLAGPIKPEEGLWLIEAARCVPAGTVIVEVGSYTGKSMSCLATGSAAGNQVPVYAVDPWLLNVRVQWDTEQAWKTFQERVTRYDIARVVRPIMGWSHLSAAKVVEPIGLLFIDGNHSYQGVRRDWMVWAPKLASGGIVAFHDYRPLRVKRTIDVARFVDEIVIPSSSWEAVPAVGTMYATRRLR